MTWPFENDTSAIVTKLAKRSLKSEKRRNRMVVIAVALAAFLISFAAILSVSVAQIQTANCPHYGSAVYFFRACIDPLPPQKQSAYHQRVDP